MLTYRSIFFLIVYVSLSGCGDTGFTDKKQANERGAHQAQLNGDKNCYELGDSYGPYQGATPYQGKPGGKVIVISEPDIVVKKPGYGYNPCEDVGEPNPFPPKGHPGQYPKEPCSYDCDDDFYDPIGPSKPTPFPGQHPIQPDQCGKEGYLCGGPGQHPGQWQWPGQTVSGTGYDRDDVKACMNSFARAGYNTTGMWGIDTRTIRNISIFADDIIEDRSVGPKIIIVKSFGLMGVSRFRFLNPDALYCVQNTNILEDVRITSCHTSNVVFGRDRNFLSTVDSRTVPCI